MSEPHETLRRFEYPLSEVASYSHWSVLLRREQVTAGSLVLCAKSDANRFGSLPSAAYAELETVSADIETALRAAVAFEKINYLMFMMNDPQVHFHVIPRYDGERSVCGLTVTDAGWPRTPALEEHTTLDDEQFAAVADYVRQHWPGAG